MNTAESTAAASAMPLPDEPGLVPPWLTARIERLIHEAEEHIPWARQGRSRKRWVMRAVKALLHEIAEMRPELEALALQGLATVDLPFVPPWLQGPAKDVLLAVTIDAVFAQLPEVRERSLRPPPQRSPTTTPP